MLDFPRHLGFLGLIAGSGCLLFGGAARFIRAKEAPAEDRRIQAALTPVIVILILAGWVNLLSGARLAGEPPERVRDFAIGTLIGLAAGATAVRIGVRLEHRRFQQNLGPTPRPTMLKRAILFFFSLSVIDGALLLILPRGFLLRVGVLGALCGLWITVAVIYRRRAGSGVPTVGGSIARRGMFFGLAVAALAGLACPGFGILPAGLLGGVALSVTMLLPTAWGAIRYKASGALLLGGVAGIAGWLLLCFLAAPWL